MFVCAYHEQAVPGQLVRENKVLANVLDQGSLEFFHDFEHTLEVVKLEDNIRESASHFQGLLQMCSISAKENNKLLYFTEG